MRVKLGTILALLDGKPTGARGQSLVELTITLPVLLVMLMGLTEIGWFANNYLTLLDVAREAGRFAATGDPLAWNEIDTTNYSAMDCEQDIAFYNDHDTTVNYTAWPGPDLAAWGYSERGEVGRGYYDAIACGMLQNMEPLKFNHQTDDIVISVFQFVVVNPGTASARVRVSGRLPSKANECENDDSSDPFDWHGPLGPSSPADGLATGTYEAEYATFWDPDVENIRGYVFRGNHRNDYGGSKRCLGSEFSVDEVEAMLNFDGDADQIRKLAQATNYGLALVEIYWEHTQLLGLPWFRLGPLDETSTVHVWTFFPVSAAEPDIRF